MSLEYVDDPRRYTGVAYACVGGRTPQPKRRSLEAFTNKLVQTMGTRDIPFITAEERGRMLGLVVAAAVERREIFPEARDGR